MPVRRLLATALLLLTAAALAWPLVAAAQTGPERLWEAYPLDPREAAPSACARAGAALPVAAPEDSGDDLSLPLFLAIAAGVVCLGALIGVAGVRAFRAREEPAGRPGLARRPSPEPRPEPAPAARGGRAPRATSATRDLARLAADYLDVVAAGSRRPVMDLAERRAWARAHPPGAGARPGLWAARRRGPRQAQAARSPTRPWGLSEPAPPVPRPPPASGRTGSPRPRGPRRPGRPRAGCRGSRAGRRSNGRGGGG